MTDQTTTITVPFKIRKRGGRKLILTPDGKPGGPSQRERPDSALLKALARGFRWQKMLREGDYQTLEEIADAENINPSYVSRLLRMTLLAPEIVEAILAGTQPAGLTRAKAMQPFSTDWRDQSFR
jgi:DNA-binding CsgD family transcriptional regulator